MMWQELHSIGLELRCQSPAAAALPPMRMTPRTTSRTGPRQRCRGARLPVESLLVVTGTVSRAGSVRSSSRLPHPFAPDRLARCARAFSPRSLRSFSAFPPSVVGLPPSGRSGYMRRESTKRAHEKGGLDHEEASRWNGSQARLLLESRRVERGDGLAHERNPARRCRAALRESARAPAPAPGAADGRALRDVPAVHRLRRGPRLRRRQG